MAKGEYVIVIWTPKDKKGGRAMRKTYDKPNEARKALRERLFDERRGGRVPGSMGWIYYVTSDRRGKRIERTFKRYWFMEGPINWHEGHAMFSASWRQMSRSRWRWWLPSGVQYRHTK